MAMLEGVAKAVQELQEMEVFLEQRQEAMEEGGAVVFINYTIPNGEHSHSGQPIQLGIQVPNEYSDSYPHYVHLKADISLPRGQVWDSKIPGYRRWSRPPNDRWEGDHRNMRWYVKFHLRRIWEEKCYIG